MLSDTVWKESYISFPVFEIWRFEAQRAWGVEELS